MNLANQAKNIQNSIENGRRESELNWKILMDKLNSSSSNNNNSRPAKTIKSNKRKHSGGSDGLLTVLNNTDTTSQKINNEHDNSALNHKDTDEIHFTEEENEFLIENENSQENE